MQDHIKTFSMRLLWLDEMMRSEFEKLFISQRSYRSSDKEAFIRGCEAAFKHQQSKVDDLQKRVDAALKLIPSLKSENDLWGCEQVERQIELLEQALKGGGE